MGNKPSKPARKLTQTLKAAPTVNRVKVNQLPSESLKQQYEDKFKQPSTQTGSPGKPDVATSNDPFDSSLKQSRPNTQFDPRLLQKKLKQKNVVPHEPTNQNVIPEGKDGFDPQVEEHYNAQFVSSINQLGKQIHSQTVDAKMDKNVLALNQLTNRKSMYEQGEKEKQEQLEPQDPNGGRIQRTMVHPRTLGAILNDIHDERVKKETISEDYQLQTDFVKELGTRFRVAKNMVVIEEDTKEDEIGHKVARPSVRVADDEMMNYDGELTEKVSDKRLKQLQSRLE